MNGWLLDASVLLELRRADPDPQVASWPVARPMRLVGRPGAIPGHVGRSDLPVPTTARVHALTACARDARAYLEVGAPAFSPWGRTSNPADPPDPRP